MVSAGKSKVESSGADDVASPADTASEGASAVDAALGTPLLVALPSDAASTEVASTLGAVPSLATSVETSPKPWSDVSPNVGDAEVEALVNGGDGVVVLPAVFELDDVELLPESVALVDGGVAGLALVSTVDAVHPAVTSSANKAGDKCLKLPFMFLVKHEVTLRRG